MKSGDLAKAITAILLLSATALAFAASFELLPVENSSLALDWKGFWAALQDGRLQYHPHMHNPPWSLAFLLPLGLLPLKTSWALATLATLLVMIVSVPATDRNKWIVLCLVLVLSFPSLRHLVDGNIEALVIAGVLLLLHGYNKQQPAAIILGLLFSTAKIQETWLLLLVGMALLARFWRVRKWLLTGMAFAAIASVSVATIGQDWLESMWNIPFRNTEVNMALIAELGRLSTPPPIIPSLWVGLFAATLFVSFSRAGKTLSRENAGLLMVASMLLSPYNAANSFISVLAIGVIPATLTNQYAGMPILALSYLPYLVLIFIGPVPWFYSGYWTFVSLATWGLLAYLVLVEGKPDYAPSSAVSASRPGSP